MTESAASEAGEAANENNALESTSKAAVAAWRASQARPRENIRQTCAACVAGAEALAPDWVWVAHSCRSGLSCG